MPKTAREIANAAGIAPRTKRFVLTDEYGFACEGSRSELVLAALARSDKTDLPAEVHTAAYALRKYVNTGRSPADFAMRVMSATPYQVCAMVATIVRDCPETTIGGICDDWLPANRAAL